ncbi:MAG: YebC/PmpR family DNA-binding transcriptional regulator, partial [Acutalibacteraceae bacterium]|nr:YebC/PmpR family DNA-binding transcriptional regulator [Acutalibacteraceae bacterium]
MFMFDRNGIITIEAEGLDEDTVMEAALEAGAEDFNFDGDVFEITTAPNDLGAVRDALEAAGYSFLSAEVAYIPQTMTAIDDEDAQAKMEKLIDMLEDNDDVQAVWHNWEMPDEE